MDKELRDMLHKYLLMQDIDLKGMNLQELFDHRFHYLQLQEKVQKKFEELGILKPKSFLQVVSHFHKAG